jgi:peptidoglycan/LPS O-acetylase OafA/YrhL
VGEVGRGTLPWVSLDSLGAGALLAVVYHQPWPRETIRRVLAQAVLPVGAVVYLGLHVLAAAGNVALLVNLHEIAYAMICCWLIASADHGFGGLTGRVLTLAPVVYLGKISYGIYAYHLFMPWGLERVFRYAGLVFPAPGALRFVLASSATVLVAVASWHLFERPINDLKRLFPYSGGASGASRFAGAAGQPGPRFGTSTDPLPHVHAAGRSDA